MIEQKYPPGELFALNYRPDNTLKAMQHAMVDAAGEVTGGGIPPAIVSVLCDMIASMAVHQIDIGDLQARVEIADACRLRILRTMQGLADSIARQGGSQIDDLMPNAAKRPN